MLAGTSALSYSPVPSNGASEKIIMLSSNFLRNSACRFPRLMRAAVQLTQLPCEVDYQQILAEAQPPRERRDRDSPTVINGKQEIHNSLSLLGRISKLYALQLESCQTGPSLNQLGLQRCGNPPFLQSETHPKGALLTQEQYVRSLGVCSLLVFILPSFPTYTSRSWHRL